MTLFRSIATVAVVAMSVIAYAQTDQGRFTGTVRDQSNAFVGGATVKVKNERTGEERGGVLSNAQGYFMVPSLKTFHVHDSRLRRPASPPWNTRTCRSTSARSWRSISNSSQRAFAGRRVGRGAAPVLDIASARMGVNVGERDVKNLPVNGRQMSQLCCRRRDPRTQARARGRTSGSRAARSNRTPSATTASRARRSSTRRPAT